jgi:hypothetical protein
VRARALSAHCETGLSQCAPTLCDSAPRGVGRGVASRLPAPSAVRALRTVTRIATSAGSVSSTLHAVRSFYKGAVSRRTAGSRC